MEGEVEANRGSSNLYLWMGRDKAEVVRLCIWHQRQEQKQRWSWWVLGSSQRRRVLVYRWAVAGVLPLISLSSFQRTLPTALPSPSPLQKVPNNGAPRVDLAQKCRQCLLWGSKNSGLIQATSCAYIHSHHVFPFTILPTQPSALFQRSAIYLLVCNHK